MRNSVAMLSIWSVYRGQFSITTESELVKFTTSLINSRVMASGGTWPFASMLLKVRPTSVLRSISLSRSLLQSTEYVFDIIFASSGAKTSVPLCGMPRARTTPGFTLSRTRSQTAPTSWASKPSSVLGPRLFSRPSMTDKLRGIFARPGRPWIMACISPRKYASVLIMASPPVKPRAAMSSESARVKSKSRGLDVQGTMCCKNSTCFRLCGKSQITKLETPIACPRYTSDKTKGHARDASTGLPLARACLTESASF
mmetsp:Transcript_54739/g.157411  ORF Transcript_54739/g.157411 Transcript_54739/m.157411 type:complete len:256 (+) Transcript_54739:1387-2154(+)